MSRFMLALIAAAGVVNAEPAPRMYVVNGPAPAAADDNPGTEQKPLRTIQAAARQAGPGDTVLVHAGVYRERVTPLQGGTENRPIVYAAAPGETVVVKGSDLWPDWRPAGNRAGVYVTDLPADSIAYRTSISIAPRDKSTVVRPGSLTKTLGQLFWDGEPVIQVESTNAVWQSENTWVVLPEGRQILAHFAAAPADLATHRIELTLRDRIFAPERRGLGYIQVRGFVFEHCANQGPFPQGGAVSPRSGHHWVFENNTIRYAKTTGLDVGSETWEVAGLKNTRAEDKVKIEGGHHLVQGNRITDNGLCGIEGWHHNGVIIRNNIIERNNRLDFSPLDAEWEEWGGIKLHGPGAWIEGNLIRDNEAFGIWIDNDYQNSRVTRNVVLNNRMAGIFLELGAGPVLVDRNIIAGTRPRGNYFCGMGVYAHDASDITVAHNLIMDCAGGGVVMRTTSDRQFGGRLVETSRERILNNIIWNNSAPAINLPYPNPRGTNNVSDYNLLFGTHEYWQGLDAPWPGLFAVNKFKGEVPISNIVARLRDVLAKPNAVPDGWPRNPVLDLPTWRRFMGMDVHSVENAGALTVQVRPRVPTLVIAAKPVIKTLQCPKIAGIDRDFFGNAIPDGEVVPGPFQTLTETKQEFVLFPVETSQ